VVHRTSRWIKKHSRAAHASERKHESRRSARRLWSSSRRFCRRASAATSCSYKSTCITVLPAELRSMRHAAGGGATSADMRCASIADWKFACSVSSCCRRAVASSSYQAAQKKRSAGTLLAHMWGARPRTAAVLSRCKLPDRRVSRAAAACHVSMMHGLSDGPRVSSARSAHPRSRAAAAAPSRVAAVPPTGAVRGTPPGL
jgi:hypothetical protein